MAQATRMTEWALTRVVGRREVLRREHSALILIPLHLQQSGSRIPSKGCGEQGHTAREKNKADGGGASYISTCITDSGVSASLKVCLSYFSLLKCPSYT